MKRNCARGFTMVELMFAIAVIAILAAIGTVAYQMYTERSRAADILVKYDAIRSGVGAEVVQSAVSKCADVAQKLSTANLDDEYARLGYGFEAVSGGYRPVLTVCAKLDRNGPLGVKVARGAHGALAKTARVEKGAVLTETLVSFALPLTDSDKPVCFVPYGGPLTACGDPVAVPTTTAPKAPTLAPLNTPTPQASATPSITTCPPGQILADVTSGGKGCWTPPSCPDSNEMYYVADSKCHPKPAKACDPPNQLFWTADAGPLCVGPGGDITPLGIQQPNAGPSGTSAGAVPAGATGLGASSAVQGSAGIPSPSINPAQRVQQCKDNCRVRYPHGNSRAYRSCLAACN